MTASTDSLKTAAKALANAYQSRSTILPLSPSFPEASIADAYAVQEINTENWLAAGRVLTGRKVGLTARAVQQAFGIDQPDFGMLFADMAYCDGDTILLGQLLQPKIEGEIAFCLGRGVEEPVTLIGLISSIEYAIAAVEVVDSRIADWKIGIFDTIADNASSGAYVLGTSPVRLDAFDHHMCGMVIEHRGEPVSTGAGAACLGNPLSAALWVTKKMAAVGRPLGAGDIILSGALGPMVPVTGPGSYELRINGLGSVGVSFER